MSDLGLRFDRIRMTGARTRGSGRVERSEVETSLAEKKRNSWRFLDFARNDRSRVQGVNNTPTLRCLKDATGNAERRASARPHCEPRRLASCRSESEFGAPRERSLSLRWSKKDCRAKKEKDTRRTGPFPETQMPENRTAQSVADRFRPRRFQLR